jgi:hypothetical protein
MKKLFLYFVLFLITINTYGQFGRKMSETTDWYVKTSGMSQGVTFYHKQKDTLINGYSYSKIITNTNVNAYRLIRDTVTYWSTTNKHHTTYQLSNNQDKLLYDFCYYSNGFNCCTTYVEVYGWTFFNRYAYTNVDANNKVRQYMYEYPNQGPSCDPTNPVIRVGEGIGSLEHPFYVKGGGIDTYDELICAYRGDTLLYWNGRDVCPQNPNLCGDTVRISVFDTIHVVQTTYDTITTNIYDTTYINQTVYDTVKTYITDTTHIHVYDTTYVLQNIYDTVYVTIQDTNMTYLTDTTFISVTDTLIIYAILTNLSPPNNYNILKVYPNPANDKIIVETGNYNLMLGYAIKITNDLGQNVFMTQVNQQLYTVDLNTWTGQGVYFLYIIDNFGSTIEVKKLVLK